MEEHPFTSMLKFFLLSLLALLVLVSSGLLYRWYEQNRIKNATRITTNGGIDLSGSIMLGGEEQWVLIRGKKQTNPVLLYLHGGPGSFIIPRARELGRYLENDFVVAYWDQRGSGKSFRAGMSPEEMELEQFVSDTHNLVDALRRRFNVPKVYLVGNSWGAALGLIVAHQHPELFYAYVGTGQLVNAQLADSISYAFTLAEAEEANNNEALRELTEMGPPPWDYMTMKKQRKWLRRFGGTIYEESESTNSLLSDFLGKMLLSPEYTLMEVFEYGTDPNFAVRNLRDDIEEINLFEQIQEIDVPVYFIAGRHDYNTPSVLVKQFHDSLDAPRGKHFIWFDNSAHTPEFEEPEEFHRIMIDSVLAQTHPVPDLP